MSQTKTNVLLISSHVLFEYGVFQGFSHVVGTAHQDDGQAHPPFRRIILFPASLKKRSSRRSSLK
jgi:hypothetical protein